MEKAGFDPGLTQQYAGNLKRVINKQGEFNVYRSGSTWRDSHPYLFLVNLTWPQFFLILLAAYLAINTLFAGLYIWIGTDSIYNAQAPTAWRRFVNILFFSSHTLTTVGYGNMYPLGIRANILAALEALTGLLSFAIATGLVFGRFSRPSARIGFSDSM